MSLQGTFLCKCGRGPLAFCLTSPSHGVLPPKIGEVCMPAQSCPTLWDPMDCSPPSSSVRGISPARILEWVAISSSKGYSWPRDRTRISCIGRRVHYHWANWEAHTRGLGVPNIPNKASWWKRQANLADGKRAPRLAGSGQACSISILGDKDVASSLLYWGDSSQAIRPSSHGHSHLVESEPRGLHTTARPSPPTVGCPQACLTVSPWLSFKLSMFQQNWTTCCSLVFPPPLGVLNHSFCRDHLDLLSQNQP